MDHKTTLRILGVATITILVLGIGLFQAYGGKSFVETLYEIFILVIGGLGAIALQLIIWPERFLPKKPLAKLETPQLPDIQGKIMGDMRGQIQNPKNASETLTGFTLFVSLTNASMTPAHVRDYEFYVDIGSGFERMSIFRGISSMNFHFEYQGRELEITDFNKRLLSYQNKPIEFGIPFEGILLFAGAEKYYKAPIRMYKLICVDIFGQRHEIVTDPKDLPDIGFIADRFGVKGL